MMPAQNTIPGLNRFLSNVVNHTLTAFVVPGVEIARAYQLDLENIGFTTTDIPRHANVLLLIGEIPEDMRQHALTLYNQMPNPKAILAVGITAFDPLPAPDATADFSEQSIKLSVGKLQELFSKKAFEKNGTSFPNSKHQTSKRHDTKNMEGMAHGSDEMGFMSMVMMTENLPKSQDVLPMEWGEVHFGPLFAGLPAGLELTFLLDGDSVAQTEVSTDSVKRNLEKKWLGNGDNFLSTFSIINPLAPHTYRILAEQALENAMKKPVDEKTKSQRILLLEKEHVISHLNWLTSFAALLQYFNLLEKAEKCVSSLRNTQTASDYKLLEKDMKGLQSSVENHWLLKKRLAGIGKDTGDGSDAWTRLLLRLLEINQSISMLTSLPVIPDLPPLSSSGLTRGSMASRWSLPRTPIRGGNDRKGYNGKASLKTPRGQAELSIKLQNGKVTAVSFSSPSAKKIDSIGQFVQNKEVGDALVAVASLDISPWEVAL